MIIRSCPTPVIANQQCGQWENRVHSYTPYQLINYWVILSLLIEYQDSDELKWFAFLLVPRPYYSIILTCINLGYDIWWVKQFITIRVLNHHFHVTQLANRTEFSYLGRDAPNCKWRVKKHRSRQPPTRAAALSISCRILWYHNLIICIYRNFIRNSRS